MSEHMSTRSPILSEDVSVQLSGDVDKVNVDRPCVVGRDG
jgi:hypothetical protein